MFKLYLMFLLLINTVNGYDYKPTLEFKDALNSGICEIYKNGDINAMFDSFKLSSYYEVPSTLTNCEIKYPIIDGTLKSIINDVSVNVCMTALSSQNIYNYTIGVFERSIENVGNHYNTIINKNYIDVGISSSYGYFGSLFYSLNKCDIVVSTTTITDKRSKTVDFLLPFLSDKNGVVRSRRDPSKGLLNTLDDIRNSKSLKVATIPNSIYSDWFSKNLPSVQVITTADLETGINLIVGNIVDIFIWDYSTLKIYFENHTMIINVYELDFITNDKAFFVMKPFPLSYIILIVLGTIIGSIMILYLIVATITSIYISRLCKSIKENKKITSDMRSSIYELETTSKDTEIFKTFKVSQTLKDWIINERDIAIKTKIGSGSFGIVYSGLLRGLTSVAIKTYNRCLSENSILAIIEEAKMAITLQHPNVVQFLGICINESIGISLVYELMLSDLSSYIPKMSFSQKFNVIIDISNVMADLHTRTPPIIHRDLKPDNVLISQWGIAKISDFGLSKRLDELNTKMNTVAGTPYWMAPEVIRGQIYDEKCDVYSFSVIIWQLLSCKQRPYDETDPFKIQYDVATAGLRPFNINDKDKEIQRLCNINKNVDTKLIKFLIDIVLTCWDDDATKRLSFVEIYRLLKTYDVYVNIDKL